MAISDRRRRNPRDAIRYEIQGLLLLGAAGIIALGLAEQLTGFVGIWLTQLTNRVFGELAWGLVVLLSAAGLHGLVARRPLAGDRRAAGALLGFLVALGAWHLYRTPAGLEWENGMLGVGGGVAGAVLTLVFTKALGRTGGAVALAVGGAVALVLVSGIGLAAVVRAGLVTTWRFLVRVWQDLVDFLYLVRDEPDRGAEPRKWAGGDARARERTFGGLVAGPAPEPGDARAAPARGSRLGASGHPPDAGPDAGPGGSLPPAPHPAASGSGSPSEEDPQKIAPRLRAIAGGKARRTPSAVPRPFDLSRYQLPPLTLLSRGPRLAWRGKSDAEAKAEVLEETLSHFGVEARVVHIDRGPTVTRFELQPAQGVRVAKIVSLEDDLALALAARELRIEAPIPGKAAIGIEVPNDEISPVYLREVLEHPAFSEADSKLTIALGKDISGQPVVADLERLIHLLIAGATGSGKSVSLNAIIASILFKARPDEVKFLMIDPKVVELNVYDGIPHLLAPLVTDPKKAAGCLRWVVNEMLRRYEQFAEAGVRDITRYNLWARGAGPDPHAGEAPGATPLPYIIVVIDELADLMMVAQNEVEDAIWRLAQMARAAGIHLVVATQRPSVDVLTGTIKANIPSRVAFAVSSQADARTIFDSHGPEKLMGRGDMLFRPTGAARPVRAQGAFISDREVEALVRWVKEQADPEFEDGILVAAESEAGASGPEEEDPLLPDAIRVVMEHQQASASLLQRRLRVGYTRAARLIDMMEDRGIVGPHEGAKARQLLMTWEQYQRAMAALRRPSDPSDDGPDGGADSE